MPRVEVAGDVEGVVPGADKRGPLPSALGAGAPNRWLMAEATPFGTEQPSERRGSKGLPRYELPLTGAESRVAVDGFFEVVVPDGVLRVGILGRGGLQAVKAHQTKTFPTLRGLFIREELLCQNVPVAPDGVDTNIPDAPEGVVETQRMQLERHRTDPACSTCHAFIHPLGLALENFNASGFYRETEHGLPIDTSGDLDGLAFDGPVGLAAALLEHERSIPCMTQKFAEHSLGREVSEDSTQSIVTAFDGAGRSFPALINALVTSAAFR